MKNIFNTIISIAVIVIALFLAYSWYNNQKTVSHQEFHENSVIVNKKIDSILRSQEKLIEGQENLQNGQKIIYDHITKKSNKKESKEDDNFFKKLFDHFNKSDS